MPNEMEPVNLFRNIPDDVSEELFDILVHTDSIKIERIVSHGQASPDGFWYDQDTNEWVVLLQGRAGLRFKNEMELVVMKPGDYINILAHTKHRVEWTEPEGKTIWLAIHYY